MHKVPEGMYAAHKAQNYRMTEKRKYKQKIYLEQANRYREVVNTNWYKVQKGENSVSDSGKNTDEQSETV